MHWIEVIGLGIALFVVGYLERTHSKWSREQFAIVMSHLEKLAKRLGELEEYARMDQILHKEESATRADFWPKARQA
jgi:hypothetical protein